MHQTRRVFATEFKQESVRLIMNGGRNAIDKEIVIANKLKKTGHKVTDICRNLKLQPIDAKKVSVRAKVQQIDHEMHATVW